MTRARPAGRDQEMIMKTARILALAAAMSAATPVLAHHSYSMFDNMKEVKLVGTVKEFQWTNPHVWIQVVVDEPGGAKTEWSIEGAGLNTLIRQGWTRNTIKAGEKITTTINPMRNGDKGGALVRMWMPDGRVLGEPLPAGAK
jgi:hypothetical protein